VIGSDHDLLNGADEHPVDWQNFNNRLPIIAAEVQALHNAVNAATRTAVERAREAGMMLLEAKALVPHGGWQSWIRELGISARTAQGYMQLARVPESKCATVAHLGLRAALREIAAHDHPLDEIETALAEVAAVLDRWEELDEIGVDIEPFNPEHEARLNAHLETWIEELPSLFDRMFAAVRRGNDAIRVCPHRESVDPRAEQFDRVVAMCELIEPRHKLWYHQLTGFTEVPSTTS
jgi:hypothetical protein